MTLIVVAFCLLHYALALSDLGCFFCQEATQFALLNPNFGNETEHVLDQVCNILPAHEKKICLEAAADIGKVFILIAKGFGKQQYTAFGLCTMLNQCAQECCLTNSTPEQIHLSWSDDTHTTMTAMWVTLLNDPTILRFGLGPQKLTNVLTGSSSTYTKGGWIGWIHTVTMRSLQPGTRYYYQVGSGRSADWSAVYNFITEPLQRDRKIVIASIADMGNNNSQNTMKDLRNLVASNSLDFILHNGDISYADGEQIRWDAYFRSMQSTLANIPYMTNPGNHEIGVIGALDLALGYLHRFTLPGKNSISTDLENMYYSFNYGLVHFISLDTESRYDVAYFTHQQEQWLINDLKSVDRTVTPWVIAFGHRPLYCSNHDNGDDTDCSLMAEVLRNELEAIFNAYNVNLVLSGHKHNFERFWPTKQGGAPIKSYNNPGVPTYVLNGAAGNREGGQATLKHPIPNSAYYGGFVGYGIITVYNRTHLQHDFYESSTNKLMDTFTLIVS